MTHPRPTQTAVPSVVALVRCETYEPPAVAAAVRRGFELLGGASALFQQGERIVLKPNVLYGTDFRKGVSTHPSVFSAVARTIQETGARVSYGDSPSFGPAGPHMRRCGLKRAAAELGIAPADFDKGRNIRHPDGLLVKSLVLANGVLDSDGLVSLPKLKAHPLTRLTGAVKNQLGCVPGLLKAQYHAKLTDPYQFSAMLVDINTFIRPRLCIMDGIMAMEGNGPRSGVLRRVNVLLFSRDPVALDAVACRIVGLDPEVVPTCGLGEKGGLGQYRQDRIALAGEPLESFLCGDFDILRTPPDHGGSRGKLKTLFKNWTCERPAIEAARCTACGSCVRMCPAEPKALSWAGAAKGKPPWYDYNRCIRCYCCQEACPEGAVSTRMPLAGRILFRH